MLDRERGVVAGDPLLVVALASEGAPVRESKGGGAQDGLGGAPKWILRLNIKVARA